MNRLVFRSQTVKEEKSLTCVLKMIVGHEFKQKENDSTGEFQNGRLKTMNDWVDTACIV